MQIKRTIYNIELEGGLTYKVIAESFDEAISIVKKWRPGSEIINVIKCPDSLVLTKEDVFRNEAN